MKRKLNKYTEKQLKKYAGKIVRIDWLDIMGEMNKDKDELVNPLIQDLITTDSYGKVGRVEFDCLELLHEDSTINVTRTVIPISVIWNISELK